MWSTDRGQYDLPMRILVLGAGFGGLELSTKLSEEFGDDLDLVLIDQAEGFVFGFSKLDVIFGRALPSAVVHPYRDIVKPGIRFVQTTIRSIDPVENASRPTPVHSKPTSSSSRSEPTSTLRAPRGSSKPVTSSTRCQGHSLCATYCRPSTAAT